MYAMNQPAGDQGIGVEEYLDGEKDGETRHEYVAGQVYAITGASRRHGLITGAFFAAVRPGARSSGCQLFTNDMKVHVHQAGEDAFYYPDLVLTCDPDDQADYYTERPCLIVEVLSERTERIDRREKLFAYTAGLDSLREYVLVAQDRPRVEIYRRTETDWVHEIHTEGPIHLECLDMHLSVETIYEDIEATPRASC
jgi:Uma2 family endonuclease